MAIRIDSFVARLNRDLDNVKLKGAPVKRRLATICTSCGRRFTQTFLDQLHRALKKADIHSDLKQTCSSHRRQDWVTFSRTALPNTPALFSKEKALACFVRSQIGRVYPFDGLRLLPRGQGTGIEFEVLHNGRRRRVDLLCMDKNPGRTGGYVAIEFKKEHAPAAIAQVRAYLDALEKQLNAPVRAIIVSAKHDEITAPAVSHGLGSRITWIYYSVTFEPANSGISSPASSPHSIAKQSASASSAV